MNPLLFDLLSALAGFVISGGVGTTEQQFNPAVTQKPTLGDWLRVALGTGVGAGTAGVLGGLGGTAGEVASDAATGASAAITEGAGAQAFQPLPLRPNIPFQLTTGEIPGGSTTPFIGGQPPPFMLPVNSDRLAFSPTTGVSNVFTPGAPLFQPAPLPPSFSFPPTPPPFQIPSFIPPPPQLRGF